MNDIKELIAGEKENVITTRRTLHRIPELAFKENKTCEYVYARLQELPGLEIKKGVAGTGILAVLDTGRKGKTLLIRADMDALPIREETGAEYASTHDGCMHACGHDAHMTMLLVTAKLLAGLKDQLTGVIKFMFQPAEEWPGGAKPMIDEGILENPHVDYSVGAHVWPLMPEGTISLRPGVMMSAASMFKIEIIGKGGHGAMPHLCVDALDIAGQVVNALQRVVSRKINPLVPSVVTVGSMHAGDIANAIPERAVLQGTTRTFDRKVWNDYPAIMEPIIKGICEANGASYNFHFEPGYPPLINDEEIVGMIKKSMAKVVGEENIHELEPTMGGEDMAYVIERTKGCYFFVGTGYDGCAALHNAKFDLHEESLLVGIETFVQYAMDLLGE